jgi:tetratricopeptide (TPR) repeat protein
MFNKLALFFVIGIMGAGCGAGREAAWERGGAPAAAPAGAGGDISGLSAEADASWEKRDDVAELGKAVAAWEKMDTASPNTADILLKLARGYYLQGDHLRVDGNKDEALAIFEKGVLAGEKGMMASSDEFANRVKAGEKVADAVSSMPKSAQPIMYWYAVNLGKFASLKGFSTLLFYKNRIFNLMKQVLTLDETYFYGAPHRYFGAYFAKAPGFAGGDMNLSKEHFEKAMALFPDYLGTRVTYAEFFAIKEDDEELFDELLDAVVNGDPTKISGVEPEQRFEQYKAKKLIEQKDDIF